mmetsp:Transcript_53491/g.121969  ORF Transcript_53491/g.121969 Transcript_53491/m.121969 type:complete len:296 (+) Transcript_53491:1407-2294(+)
MGGAWGGIGARWARSPRAPGRARLGGVGRGDGEPHRPQRHATRRRRPSLRRHHGGPRWLGGPRFGWLGLGLGGPQFGVGSRSARRFNYPLPLLGRCGGDLAPSFITQGGAGAHGRGGPPRARRRARPRFGKSRRGRPLLKGGKELAVCRGGLRPRCWRWTGPGGGLRDSHGQLHRRPLAAHGRRLLQPVRPGGARAGEQRGPRPLGGGAGRGAERGAAVALPDGRGLRGRARVGRRRPPPVHCRLRGGPHLRGDLSLQVRARGCALGPLGLGPRGQPQGARARPSRLGGRHGLRG